MNKSNSVIRAAGLLGLLAYGIFASSQEWKPEMTDQWDPVPPKVTPGDGTAAPSDAIILFDGKDLSKWEGERGGPATWKVENGCFTVVPDKGSIQTRQSFGDVQLHIEFREPFDFVGWGQDHGNSGVYLQKRYEIQVLDCYDNKTYVNGQTGALYKQYPPLVNACKPTGEWQIYDIVFMAPRFNENGTLYTPATITLFHNGVLVLNHVTVQGTTENVGLPKYLSHSLKQPLMLQDHGNPVSFRNIWVREL